MLILQKVEYCQWVNTEGLIKVIMCSKIRVEKGKKLKGKNLTSLGINTSVYINDILLLYILRKALGQV